MRTRILPPEEWDRLRVAELPALLPYVAPQNIAVIVVETDDGEIVGCLAALQVTHLEGVWVKPERRRGVVLRGLLRQAMALARVRRESWVLGGATAGDEQMDDLIRRLGGAPLPVSFYTMPVKES
jgi:hypothetical protein